MEHVYLSVSTIERGNGRELKCSIKRKKHAARSSRAATQQARRACGVGGDSPAACSIAKSNALPRILNCADGLDGRRLETPLQSLPTPLLSAFYWQAVAWCRGLLRLLHSELNRHRRETRNPLAETTCGNTRCTKPSSAGRDSRSADFWAGRRALLFLPRPAHLEHVGCERAPAPRQRA
jgi:hypothetical protein